MHGLDQPVLLQTNWGMFWTNQGTVQGHALDKTRHALDKQAPTISFHPCLLDGLSPFHLPHTFYIERLSQPCLLV